MAAADAKLQSDRGRPICVKLRNYGAEYIHPRSALGFAPISALQRLAEEMSGDTRHLKL